MQCNCLQAFVWGTAWPNNKDEKRMDEDDEDEEDDDEVPQPDQIIIV